MPVKKPRTIWVICDAESLEPVGGIDDSCYWAKFDALQNKCRGEVVVKFTEVVGKKTNKKEK